MRILFLTQYYYPEVGAPQNRLLDTCRHMAARGVQVSVLTAMPNYPLGKVQEAYRGKFFMHEKIEGIDVFRTYIFASPGKGMPTRLLNYFSFVFTSMLRGIFLPGKYDYIFCQSPPLFLGISAYILSRLKGAKLLFNVSDLWPESAEKLGLIKNKTLLGMASGLEAFCYKKAYLVSGQTQGIVANIQARFPSVKVHWMPNGIDPVLYDKVKGSGWREQNGFSQEDILFIYAGIHGYAQALECLIEAGRLLRSEKHIHLIFVGSGPLKDQLIALAGGLANIHFYDVIPKQQMWSLITEIDAAIIPLKKLKLFEGAIPSKIFENLALGKPILLGVDGEARTLFIEKGKAGFFYEPENASALAQVMQDLAVSQSLREEMGRSGKAYVYEHFNRNHITESYLALLKP